MVMGPQADNSQRKMDKSVRKVSRLYGIRFLQQPQIVRIAPGSAVPVQLEYPQLSTKTS
jgi:hypothetical protein